MTKQRTDTERLDWFFDPARNWGPYAIENFLADGQTAREFIDERMDAAENAQMDEAWKWFRASDGRLYADYGKPPWYVRTGDGPPPKELDRFTETRDAAVLAAYLASKKEKT